MGRAGRRTNFDRHGCAVPQLRAVDLTNAARRDRLAIEATKYVMYRSQCQLNLTLGKLPRVSRCARVEFR